MKESLSARKKWSKKKIIIVSCVGIVAIYLLVCLCLTLSDLITMVRQNKTTRDMELGTSRYAELVESGIATEYALYSEEEIARNPNLCMAKLYYFPTPSGQKTEYAIIVPGGGYFECDVNKVAFPAAATINKLGYTSFVLAYRYGKYSSRYAPIDDLARAVRFVTEHADEFNVEKENYFCCGYSAGGNLVGNFGTKDLGYEKYAVNKPKAVALVYPWININGKTPITGNCFQELVSAVGKLIGNKYLLGKGATEKEKQGVCVQNHIDADYPATYLLHGDDDFVVPHAYNSDVMAAALSKNNVPYRYKLCHGLNHGFGLGKGTEAEGWVEEAVAFWRAQF